MALYFTPWLLVLAWLGTMLFIPMGNQTALAAGDLVYAALTWPAWWTAAISGIMLALLLARPTRRYARRGRPRVGGWFHRGRAA